MKDRSSGSVKLVPEIFRCSLGEHLKILPPELVLRVGKIMIRKLVKAS